MVDDPRTNHATNLSTMFPEIDLIFIEFMLHENQKNIPNTLESLLRFQKFINTRDLKKYDGGSEDASPPPYNSELVDTYNPVSGSHLGADDSEVEQLHQSQIEKFSENHAFLRKRYINYKTRHAKTHGNAVSDSSTSMNSTLKNSTSENSFSVINTQQNSSDRSSSSSTRVPMPLPKIPAKNKSSSNNNGKRNRETRTARHSKMLPVPSGNCSPKSPKKTILHDRSEWQTFED